MRLALGTAQFGLSYGIANQDGQVARSEVARMLLLAAERGIDTLDTAIAYGDSEASLGEVGAEGFRLVTKLPALPECCADVRLWVREQFAGSLARLGVGAVYGLLLHRPQQLLERDGTRLYHALQELKQDGLVLKVGVSVYCPAELAALTARYRYDLVQAPFNLLDRRLESSGWLRRLKDEGVEVHTRSSFLQGLLLMPAAAIPAKFAPWASLWRRWHDWLALHQLSALQGSLAFSLARTDIDRVVVGAQTMEQLGQIIDAAGAVASVNFPDMQCDDEDLINPARWPQL